jgi:cytochrome c556
MNRTIRSATLSLAFLSAAAFGQQPPAGPSAEDAIKARQGLMQLQKFNRMALSNALKDGANVTDAVVKQAEALQTMAEMMPMTFALVKDSGLDKHKGDTRAKPEIWRNDTEFKEVAMAFQKETQKLADAAKAKDAKGVRDQMKLVGDGCNSCHKKFRAEQ